MEILCKRKSLMYLCKLVIRRHIRLPLKAVVKPWNVANISKISCWATKASTGTWCSGITPAQHAGGPGFSPQCVHWYVHPCYCAPRLIANWMIDQAAWGYMLAAIEIELSKSMARLYAKQSNGYTEIWTQGLPHATQMWYHYTMCPMRTRCDLRANLWLLAELQ